jgi:hypothetical protein
VTQACRSNATLNSGNSISRYVAPVNDEQPSTLAEATAQLKAALEQAYAAEDRLLELLRAEGLVGEGEVAAA